MPQTYYQRHRAQIIGRSKRRYEAKRELILEQSRIRGTLPEFKAKHADYLRRYRQTERGKEVRKRSREKERIAAKSIKRWRTRKPYMEEYLRKYYEDNRDKILAAFRLYYRRNKPAYMARAMARRAFLAKVAINEQAIADWKARLKASLSFRCYYCYKTFSTMEVHIDHIIPLSKKGPHEIGNLCASCPKCNLTKREKLISEWRRVGQQILPL